MNYVVDGLPTVVKVWCVKTAKLYLYHMPSLVKKF